MTDDFRAKLFQDRVTPGDWRVERFDEDGACEVAIFSGTDAYQRAVLYADRLYGQFEEITLGAVPERADLSAVVQLPRTNGEQDERKHTAQRRRCDRRNPQSYFCR
jgi:hypothetical protein